MVHLGTHVDIFAAGRMAMGSFGVFPGLGFVSRLLFQKIFVYRQGETIARSFSSCYVVCVYIYVFVGGAFIGVMENRMETTIVR